MFEHFTEVSQTGEKMFRKVLSLFGCFCFCAFPMMQFKIR